MASVVERSRTFLDEVVTETKKITWPTREDLIESTRVVIVAVILLSIILGATDWVLGWVMKFILRLA